MRRLPLFVFGTLRRGQCNHHLLHGTYERVEPARLPHHGKLHPLMIVPRENSAVTGELYFLREQQYRSTMRRCDALEEIPPTTTIGAWYRRNVVQVETPSGKHLAWAYLHPNVQPEYPDRRDHAISTIKS